MRSKGQQPNLQRKLTALVAGLCLTIILTVCFMVAVVQVQSAITAYTWGDTADPPFLMARPVGTCHCSLGGNR